VGVRRRRRVDEPETLAGLGIAARENLDNLIFVVNCNLQRLDGPVRGNGKIIQELEGHFRGAGWNVLKVIWGRRWDPLLANDHDRRARALMGETLDGDYQTFKSRDGAYVRENFFGRYPETRALVADGPTTTSGGSTAAATIRTRSTPRTRRPSITPAARPSSSPRPIKGYGLGTAGEGMNIAHNTKKLAEDQLRSFRDRFSIPISDRDREVPYIRPEEDSPEMQYLREREAALGGRAGAPPQRRSAAAAVPKLDAFDALLEDGRARDLDDDGVHARSRAGARQEHRPASCRSSPTNRARSAWKGCSASSASTRRSGSSTNRKTPTQLMWYREDKSGQILQEGINEAGAICSWIAAATSLLDARPSR
jgi:pyruvate dehydrogenase E1 component